METGHNFKAKSESSGSVSAVSGMIGRFRKATSQTLQSSRAQAVYYIPGIFLVCMGLSLLLAPTIFVALMSGLLLYLGSVALIYGRRLMQGVEKFREVVKQVEARIYIKGQAPQWPQPETQIVAGPDKKTVYH